MRYIIVAPSTAMLLAAPVQAQECNINGNISTRGESIYHVPGQEYYNETGFARRVANAGSVQKNAARPVGAGGKCSRDRREDPPTSRIS